MLMSALYLTTRLLPAPAGKSGATGPRHDNAKHTHVFCLGIGNGVHRGLLEKMAAESGAACNRLLFHVSCCHAKHSKLAFPPFKF